MAGCAVLAAVLLWRMPSGPRDFPAIRIALALGLGLLVVSPLQAASYDAMIFPLLAVFPPSRLDWVVVARNMALTAGSTPFLLSLNPLWLTAIERTSILGSPTLAQAAIAACLLWLCTTRRWALAGSGHTPPADMPGIAQPLSAGGSLASAPSPPGAG
jgi:hypothetical protein